MFLALVLATALQVDGFGECPAFTHLHSKDLSQAYMDEPLNTVIFMDGKCHRDSDDVAIEPKQGPELKRRTPEPEVIDPATLPDGWKAI